MSKKTRVKKFRIDQQFDHISTLPAAIHHYLENCSDDPQASVQLNLKNDEGKLFSIGLCSSNCNLPGTEGPNSAGLILEADANTQIASTYQNRVVFKNNPDSDGNFSKVVEIASIEKDGGGFFKGFSKIGNISPEFKIMYLEGVTPSQSNTQTYTTTIEKQKIISEPEIIVESSSGNLIPRNHDGVLEKYEASFDNNGDLVIHVFAAATSVSSRNFRGIVFYTK